MGRTSETSNGLGSLFKTTLSDKPPGRLGGEEDEDGKGSGEHPLKSDRHTEILLANLEIDDENRGNIPESSLLVKIIVAISHSTDDNRTNGPEHLKHLRSRSSKLERHDLGTVGGRIGDENTPGNTLKELSDEHDGQRVGKVEDEDEGVEEHETQDGSPSVSDTAGDGTGDGDTDDGANGATDLESRLPLCLDNIFALGVTPDTVSVGESGEGDEVTDEENTVSLHDLQPLKLATIHQ